jgi:glycosyltransferase involved in cell wall biosynthesis
MRLRRLSPPPHHHSLLGKLGLRNTVRSLTRSTGRKRLKLKIAMIGCPFRTTYGSYTSSLRSAIERLSGTSVQWVATNCGCGDTPEIERRFQVNDTDFFEMQASIAGLNILEYSPNPAKQILKSGVRHFSNHRRVARYADLASGADIIHLQQTLNAYGSDVAFKLLRQPVSAVRVITAHELGPEQVKHPELNRAYNLAGAVIVHDNSMKEKLVSLGVDAEKVHVVCCGTELAEASDVPRDGIVFYGGHHLFSNKGLSVLLLAYRLMKDRLHEKLPPLRIHGHYGTVTPHEALEMAREAGVQDDVEWLNEISMEEIGPLYQRSQVCVLPYTGSFAGMSAAIAAANGLPIIATRRAGIPEHIGDLGIWINGTDPEELARTIEDSLQDQPMLQAYGTRLRDHAEKQLGWDTVARKTLAIYKEAIDRAQQTAA